MKEVIKSIIISPAYWAIIIPALVAVLTFYLTKRYEIESEWKKEKLNHYKVLISSLSKLDREGEADDDIEKAIENFALAFNTIALVAPQAVISALIEFHKQCENKKDYKEPLKKLMLEIRKDIGLSKKDNQKTFDFYFVGSKPKN